MIDARPALDPRRTGVGQYAQQLIRHLPLADPDNEYVAWYLHARGLLRPRRFFADVRARNLTEKASRFPARIFQPASYRLGIPRVEWLVDFDLFVATNFLAPATSHADRVVPIVHDLAFQHFPESAPHIDERWRRRFAATLAGSPAIIVPSASAADDLRDAFPVAGRPGPRGASRRRCGGVRPGPGGRHRRRPPSPRHPRSVRVVRRRHRAAEEPRTPGAGVRQERRGHLSLVLAGGPVRWFPEATERLDATIELLPEGVRGRIVRTGYVSERDKLALLSGATVLAYPSLYEGFGFPVLEGFAAGVSRPDVERVLAPRGGGRGGDPGRSGGRRRDRRGALRDGRRRGPAGGALRRGGGESVAFHVGGDGTRDRRRVAETPPP